MVVRNILVVAIAMVGGAASAQTNLTSPVSDQPTVATEIRRGMDRALDCHLKNSDSLAEGSCVFDSQSANEQQHSNHLPFDVGLYFLAWWSQDMSLQMYQKLAPTNDVAEVKVQSALAESKLFYSSLRRSTADLKVSDEQILSLTDFNDGGKAGARQRLEFWSTQIPSH